MGFPVTGFHDSDVFRIVELYPQVSAGSSMLPGEWEDWRFFGPSLPNHDMEISIHESFFSVGSAQSCAFEFCDESFLERVHGFSGWCFGSELLCG